MNNPHYYEMCFYKEISDNLNAQLDHCFNDDDEKQRLAERINYYKQRYYEFKRKHENWEREAVSNA